MYEQSLSKSGLTTNQSMVYEALLKHGALPAGKLTKKVPMERGMVYKTLEELGALQLVIKTTPLGKAAFFEPAHPLKLKEFTEKREQEAKDAKVSLEGVLPGLISDFNLISGRPGVQFFEGKAGVEHVLEDSLTAKGIIYTYADIEAVVRHIKDINERYVQKRERRGIKKKVLLLDSPFARDLMKTYHPGVTEARLISLEAPPFRSIMEIYDNRISYITFSKDTMIGVIIDDKAIYEMHKYLFEYMWEKTPVLTPATS